MTNLSWSSVKDGIRTYGDQEEGDDYYVDKKTCDKAIEIANDLERLNFPVPRIMSTGDDCIVFTWGYSIGKKAYLCITYDEDKPDNKRYGMLIR